MKVARTARPGRSFHVMSGVRAFTHEANNASAEANRAPKTSSRTAERAAVRTAGSHACTPLLGFNVRPSQLARSHIEAEQRRAGVATCGPHSGPLSSPAAGLRCPVRLCRCVVRLVGECPHAG